MKPFCNWHLFGSYSSKVLCLWTIISSSSSDQFDIGRDLYYFNHLGRYSRQSQAQPWSSSRYQKIISPSPQFQSVVKEYDHDPHNHYNQINMGSLTYTHYHIPPNNASMLNHWENGEWIVKPQIRQTTNIVGNQTVNFSSANSSILVPQIMNMTFVENSRLLLQNHFKVVWLPSPPGFHGFHPHPHCHHGHHDHYSYNLHDPHHKNCDHNHAYHYGAHFHHNHHHGYHIGPYHNNHQIHHHHHDHGWGWPGWYKCPLGWNGTHFTIKTPTNHHISSHHSGWHHEKHHSGWDFHPQQGETIHLQYRWKRDAHYPYGGHNHHYHHHKGWGWDWGLCWKKICDPNDEPPFILNTIDDIPKNSTFYTGAGKPAVLADLPQFLVPKPPVRFSVGILTELPSNYTSMLTNIFAVQLNLSQGTFDEKITKLKEGEISNSSEVSAASGQNSYQITTMLIGSPVLSVPLNGTISRFFNMGLKEREKAFVNETHRHPYQIQVDILKELWSEIENEEEKHFEEAVPDSAPLLVSLVQQFSIPEPDTSEKAILDAAFNFGLQASRIEFADEEMIINSWQKGRLGQYQQNTTIERDNDINSMDEFNEWVRVHAEALRGASVASYEPAQDMAAEIFEQDQYFIHPPGGCSAAVDPQKNRGAVSMNCMSSSVDVRGPSRRCFPPRRC